MKVVLIGHFTRDLLIHPDGAWRLPGGTVVYAQRVYEASGWEVGIVTSGDLESCREAFDGSAAHLRLQASDDTTSFVNEYDAQGNRRQVLLARASPVGDLPAETFSSDLLHFGPLWRGDLSPALFAEARARQLPFAVDLQGFLRPGRTGAVTMSAWTEIGATVRGARFIKASLEEGMLATGSASVRDIGETIMGWGVGEVLVTDGADGCHVFGQGAEHFEPAGSPQRTIDVTGSGDVFFAGYCASRMAGQAIPEASARATRLAGVNVAHRGAPPVGAFARIS